MKKAIKNTQNSQSSSFFLPLSYKQTKMKRKLDNWNWMLFCFLFLSIPFYFSPSSDGHKHCYVSKNYRVSFISFFVFLFNLPSTSIHDSICGNKVRGNLFDPPNPLEEHTTPYPTSLYWHASTHEIYNGNLSSIS